MHQRAVPILSLLLLSAQPPPAIVEIEVSGMRGNRGLLQVCLTQDRSHFPNCAEDPRALRQTVPASTHRLRFSTVASGHYAVTLFHDANANRRFDTTLGIPREGFGFSRNPKLRFGAPRFDEVTIETNAAFTRAPVRLQYVL